MKKISLALALLATFSTAALAEDIEVKNAWARATIPGQEVGAVYLTITSKTPAKIVKVASPVSNQTELHTMALKSGVMEMRKLDSMDLPAGKSVSLAPGGSHIMLIGLKKPLKEGDQIPLTLSVENAPSQVQKIEIKADVKNMLGGAMHEHQHH